MNEIWLMSPNARLKKWRSFRKDLVNLEYMDAITACVELWSSAPISSRVLDIYNTDTWLRPWDLLWSGDLDQDAITLGMAYTLQLGGISDNEIRLVQDQNKTFLKLIVVVDNQYVLSYSYGEIEDIKVLEDVDTLTTVPVQDLL